MHRSPLVPCRFLDPRPAEWAAAHPIQDAVNIPLDELPHRTFELPAREQIVKIPALGEIAQQTATWLAAQNRRAEIREDFALTTTSCKKSIGRLWSPNPLLAEWIDRRPAGRALELACGTGRDAVFLASRGWQVTAIDILPDSIERGRSVERRCAAAVEPIDWRIADIESSEFRLHGQFDLISGFRYLHRPLVPRLGQWLNPGGWVIYETFTQTHRQHFGKPAREDFLLNPGELRRLLAGFEILFESEAFRPSAHTAQIVAERVK